MSSNTRIAIRVNATELSKSELDAIGAGYNSTGPGQITGGEGGSCDEYSTNCWVTGGDFVYNDDGSTSPP